MLKSSLLVFAAVALAVVCLPIAGRNPQAAPAQAPATGKSPKPTAESQAKAKEIYKRDCALCHGATGNGKGDLATGMNLTLANWTDPKALADKQDSDLFTMIRNGKNQMPAEDPGRASDSEVSNLIIYIRSLSKNQPPAPADAPAPAPAPATN